MVPQHSLPSPTTAGLVTAAPAGVLGYLGGFSGSVGVDMLRLKEPNYRRAMLIGLLAGIAGAGFGYHVGTESFREQKQ